MQADPGSELRGRVLEGAMDAAAPVRPTRRRVGLKTALIAAVLVLLSLTTAAAYGNEIIAVIEQFMFGGSSAARVESIGDGNVAIGFEIVNRDKKVDPNRAYGGFYKFGTVEEARQAAPFDLKAPSWIPEGLKLTGVDLLRYRDKSYAYDAHVTYEIWFPEGGNGRLTLFQYYAGPGATVDLKTVEPLQKVMVGDIEASVVQYGKEPHLYWMQDDILFELFSGVYGLDTLAAVAASVR